MYLAMLILLISVGIYLQNIASLFVIPFFIVYITRYQIVPEEEILTQFFGEEYLQYKHQVRRWL